MSDPAIPLSTSPPRAPASLLIYEIYRSIQGESSYAGQPCSFVRLTGCPLRCVWCDTEYAFSGGERLALADVLGRVRALGVNLVEVTGGEPLAQPACLDLLRALCDAGHQVLLETSGAIDIGPVDPRVIRIVDIKCPGSGESGRNRWENLAALAPHDELKFVLAGREDYDWARRTLAERGLLRMAGGAARIVHFSPVHGKLDPAELAAWILEDSLPVRLQVQLHKYIWDPKARGV